MKLTIDNLDGAGARDYSAWVAETPKIARKLNAPSLLTCALATSDSTFVVPIAGARVVIEREGGAAVFTGHINENPRYEYMGWAERGPVYRYALSACGDEWLLDQKPMAAQMPFVETPAEEIAKELLAQAGGLADTSGVLPLDVVKRFAVSEAETWSAHMARLGVLARASYRLQDGKLEFGPVGARKLALSEESESFAPDGLELSGYTNEVSEVIALGQREAGAYVKDYFLGDGYTMRYYLSENPYGQSTSVLLEQEYEGTSLDEVTWETRDPQRAVAVNSGRLWTLGGTGVDGETRVSLKRLLEMGGALQLQHGEAQFQGASDGVLGGLYAGEVKQVNCVAGFRVRKSGEQSSISALIAGGITGGSVTTITGHRYLLTTRIYANETNRAGQRYHSALHEAGEPLGGDAAGADARVVLEVHDIDPNNLASQMAPSTVLFDGVVANVAGFCTYALINSAEVHCSIAYTRLVRAANVCVRTALPGASYRTRLAGAMTEGAECRVSFGDLQFFSAYPPASNEKVIVSYRAGQQSWAKARSGREGRTRLAKIASPSAASSPDCQNAAKALLEDSSQTAWSGSYSTWSDFLPSGAADVFPGEVLQLDVPSRGCEAEVVVREVEAEIVDLAGDHARYRIRFANDAAEPLDIRTESPDAAALAAIRRQEAGDFSLAALTAAEVTAVTSTSVTMDAGREAPAGGGFEIRRSDSGWSADVDRNLIGRFQTKSITVPRLARVQDYFVRQYDSSGRYSRVATLLHVDYPL